MEYLRDRQHYDDLYDRLTVEECRRLENSHRDSYVKLLKDKKNKEEDVRRAIGVSHHLAMLFTTGERQVKKEETINEWIQRDTIRQERLENAEAPDDVICLSCSSEMFPGYRTLYDWADESERVLFMFDCPNGCLPRRSLFDDGTEYKPKPRLCEKCGGEVSLENRSKGKTFTIIEKCNDCSHETVDEYKPKKEKKDPHYEEDRKRFCNLSDEQVAEFEKTKRWFVDVKAFMEDIEERDKHKDEYKAIKQLEKLSVPQMQTKIKEVVNEKGYGDLTFEKPDMGKMVQAGFTCLDEKGRDQYSSRQQLKKTIEKSLNDTNWRLMSDGIDYRLGVLTGRVRCYETEEDQLKLVMKSKKS